MRLTLAVLAVVVLAVATTPLSAQTIQGEQEFRVKLLAPLSTETSQKGDKITAQVVSPRQFAGDYVEGKVLQVKNGGKIKGKSVLNFSFSSLQHKNKTIPIEAQVKSFFNSKGQQDADEEGRIVKTKSNLGKAAVATGVGALVGGLIGGGKGAAIGAGAGAVAGLILIETTATAPKIEFAAGSELILTVKQRREAMKEQ